MRRISLQHLEIAEGQLYAGASAATACGVSFAALPAWLHIALILVAGAIAGALRAALAGLLRVYFRANEVVTTIMLNYIAIIFTSYLVTGPLKDPAVPYPQSAKLARDLGCPVSCRRRDCISASSSQSLWRQPSTSFFFRSSGGYAVRVVGLNPRAAAYAGVNVAKNVLIAMAISGGLAGLAGAIEIDGVNYRLYQDISPGYGFEGIAVALLANNNPLAAIASGVYSRRCALARRSCRFRRKSRRSLSLSFRAGHSFGCRIRCASVSRSATAD